jgi:HlyD family secretion protein
LQYNEDLPLTGRVLRITPKGIKPGSGVLGTAGVGSGSSNEVATYETLIAIDNPPPEVHLQMSANVDIQVDERDQVLTIPSQAVLHRRRKDLPLRMAADLDQLAGSAPGATKDPAKQYYQTVFVNVAGKAECRIVKTGVSDEHRVEILSGLREGEQVVTGPYRVFDKLRDGKPVKEITEKDKGKE